MGNEHSDFEKGNEPEEEVCIVEGYLSPTGMFYINSSQKPVELTAVCLIIHTPFRKITLLQITTNGITNGFSQRFLLQNDID